jgi:hypothetical protein
VFKRYKIADERDLAGAGERLSAFLTGAASASPTMVPLAAACAMGEHGQFGPVRGCTAQCGGRKFLNFHCAEVAELADAGDSKSPGLTPLGVRFPSSALFDVRRSARHIADFARFTLRRVCYRG